MNRIDQLGEELDLTPEQWQDFHKFITSYFNNFGGNFLLRCERPSDNETQEQFKQREKELVERKFMEWVEIMEIRKFQKYKRICFTKFYDDDDE